VSIIHAPQGVPDFAVIPLPAATRGRVAGANLQRTVDRFAVTKTVDRFAVTHTADRFAVTKTADRFAVTHAAVVKVSLEAPEIY
jgi:hypothetical protein